PGRSESATHFAGAARCDRRIGSRARLPETLERRGAIFELSIGGGASGAPPERCRGAPGALLPGDARQGAVRNRAAVAACLRFSCPLAVFAAREEGGPRAAYSTISRERANAQASRRRCGDSAGEE